jgi:hypothetical protein
MAKSNFTSDIAVIKTKLDYIAKSIDEFTQWSSKIEERIDCIGKEQESTKTKLSILTVFQSSLSVVIGAIAAYLGGRK